jgi:EAL domain-containing protein (putative c-di-GMP-specific phosphodiesterase class I)/FixJ family two-component response regulator
MDGPPRPLVLCVDDESRVLDALRALLGLKYSVITATGAEAALALLAKYRNVAVILSDMRMPGMDGIEFLERCCALVPDAQRIMLTGRPDLSVAMSAVNRGQVFRFLTKPCPPAQLLEAVEAGAARHAALEAEKSLMQQAAEVSQRNGNPAMAEEAASPDPDEHALLQDLVDAILRDRLELHYQPVIDVSIGRIRGFEGLARWHHDRIGHVPPTRFVALAERGGEISRLGQWVLRRACLDSARLSTNGAAKVAVNVSAQELANPDFLPHLEQCLSLPCLSAGILELELTESALAKDIDMLREHLIQARSLGVSISVDDFGTGYSSLSYLSHLPVDIIKVDRVFVRDFDEGGKSIIKAALGIARDFGREVIIEGVETEEMLQRVRDIGASLVQGYLFARPMPLSELGAWLVKSPHLQHSTPPRARDQAP